MTYKQTFTVHKKELASPHIDVTFRRDRGSPDLILRFTTGDQAAFAQDLRLGRQVILTIEPVTYGFEGDSNTGMLRVEEA